MSTPEGGAVDECRFFIDELSDRELHLGSVVLNRALPPFLTNRRAATSARTLIRDARTIASQAPVADPELVATVLNEVGESFLDYGIAATRQRELAAELSELSATMVTIPYLTSDIVDVDGLAHVAAALRA